MIKNNIIHQVQSGVTTTCCFDCAKKHRVEVPYDGTYTMHLATCQICNEIKKVTSASKLFGYHKFL